MSGSRGALAAGFAATGLGTWCCGPHFSCEGMGMLVEWVEGFLR
jgi:hypothetical protein